jgi:hypothetical protein
MSGNAGAKVNGSRVVKSRGRVMPRLNVAPSPVASLSHLRHLTRLRCTVQSLNLAAGYIIHVLQSLIINNSRCRLTRPHCSSVGMGNIVRFLRARRRSSGVLGSPSVQGVAVVDGAAKGW